MLDKRTNPRITTAGGRGTTDESISRHPRCTRQMPPLFESRRDPKKISSDRSLEVYNHSPDGFEWGYGGSGPSQLSLAILLEALSDDFEQGDAPGETPDSVALHLYQDFKWQVVSGLPESQWTLPMDTIKQWIVENTNATHAREKIYQC